MTHTNTKIWFNGKKGSPACAGVTLYDTGAIVATVDDDKATEQQFTEALKTEYPVKAWVISHQARGYFYARGE